MKHYVVTLVRSILLAARNDEEAVDLAETIEETYPDYTISLTKFDTNDMSTQLFSSDDRGRFS